jgi:hypothetical protein
MELFDGHHIPTQQRGQAIERGEPADTGEDSNHGKAACRDGAISLKGNESGLLVASICYIPFLPPLM